MATKPEPGMPATVLLAGEHRPLRFPLRILKQLRVEHNIDLLNGAKSIGAYIDDIDTLSIILTAGLKAGYPDVTEDWVQDNIDASTLFDLAPALVYAVTGRWIADELAAASSGASPNGKANGSAGSISGPLADSTSGLPNTTSGN